jgi:3-oxoacyl-[acyl-carrier protein] reductase
VDLGLRGRVALVTGASSGLGRAIAHELAAEGVAVAIMARRADELKRVAAELTAQTRERVLPVPGDVTRPEDVAVAVAGATETLGPIDILVANAGGPPSTTFETTTEAQYRSAIETNMLASIMLARACVPGMRARQWGRVLFVLSMAAKEPIAGLILSNTARAGVLGFAKTLARECAPDGVLVNCVLPGHFDTPRAIELARMRAEREGRSVEEMLAQRTRGIPLGRAGDAAEFAAVVTFLASARASFVTGTIVHADGGATPAL